jgi:signal transduction histidine kinase
MGRYTYISMAPGEPALLEVSESLEREQTFIRMSHEGILLATLLVASLCGVIAMLLGLRLVGRPVRAIVEQARRMGMGDFSHRLAIGQHDEIGDLAEEMNRLCERLIAARNDVAAATEARIAALEQLRHADRLATVGQLASGVAHELGTPLSIISARAELLRAGDALAAEVADCGAVIAEQTARMTAIIRQLLDLSRRRGPQLGVADVGPIVGRTADLLAALARAHDVAVDVAPPSASLLVDVDQSQLQQALSNVIVNAIQSMPTGGRVSVHVRSCRAVPPVRLSGAPGDYVCISVEDHGPGIAPEHLARVFEPFFTTKDAGEGTGLGLSVTDGIIADHKGWIDVASVAGEGSRFDVYLPLASPPRTESPALETRA